MKIFICEDNKQILNEISTTIKNFITINDLPLKIEEQTDNPNKILSKVNNNPAACYFLDIDLGMNNISGIELGKKIRLLDPFAKLIYITSFNDMHIPILDEMISPLAYITKDKDQKEKIKTALNMAYNMYLSSLKKDSPIGKIPIIIGNRQHLFNINDIIYFETGGNHKVILNLQNGEQKIFFGKICDLEKLHNDLFRCHRSFVINMENVDTLEKNTILFKNNSSIFFSDKTIRNIKKEFKNRTI